ncbi:MAG: hypothetical protein M5R40_00830 [Anaerolineae bacterium]|nr:hypothetical protein [Anaerolineae bacterium]
MHHPRRGDPGGVSGAPWPGEPVPQLAVHKRGVVGWVERPGVIRPGDRVRVEVPEQALYSPA